MDYEFILLFKKLGNAPKTTPRQKSESSMTKEEWNQYFSSHWNFNGVKQLEHIAMFPEELPKRLIKMFSFVGETVFDPFAGSGTTSLAAKNLGRNSVGYEINEKFAPVIKEKLCPKQISFDDDARVIFLKDTEAEKYNIDELPYIFRDPHNMNKKFDIKKLQFGSRIDDKEHKREDLFTILKMFAVRIKSLNSARDYI